MGRPTERRTKSFMRSVQLGTCCCIRCQFVGRMHESTYAIYKEKKKNKSALSTPIQHEGHHGDRRPFPRQGIYFEWRDKLVWDARVSFSPTFRLSSAGSKFPCPTLALIPVGERLQTSKRPTYRKAFDLRPRARSRRGQRRCSE